MKNKPLFHVILVFVVMIVLPGKLSAQNDVFDIISFTAPKGWIKQAAESAVQFTKEDVAKKTYCMITVYKAVPTTANSKKNFDMAWVSLVKESVTVETAPEMQPASTEDGWEAQSGHAPFESNGNKGIAILITSTGFEKMVNILILTNTDVYEKNITAFLESVTLKSSSQVSRKTAVDTIAITKDVKKVSGGYTFTTTNFDDGWTSTAQENWVQVIKGTTRILIHHPDKKADAFTVDLLEGLKNAWNVLVAPRYRLVTNPQFKPIHSWEAIEFAEADAIETATGKQAHVVLFKKNSSGGGSRYLEFITPSKEAFEQEFGAYQQSSSGWDKMANMANYNKFAVAAADLTGKWTSNFSGAIQYVNAYTGFDAGMNTHASAENFHIGPGNTYKWDLAVASGMVGNIKFQSVKSAGKFSMSGNWQVNFSDIEGKPRTFNAQFTCIKGLRVLWLDGTAFARVE